MGGNPFGGSNRNNNMNTNNADGMIYLLMSIIFLVVGIIFVKIY